MFSVAEFLDRAKRNAGIVSDYQLAGTIGINTQNISSYRKGKSLPDERMVLKLCELSGDDPALVVAEFQAMRAKDDGVRELWRMVAARLAQVPAHAVAGVLLPAFVALSLIASEPDTAEAVAALPSFGNGHSLYIMLSDSVTHSQNGTPLFLLFALCALLTICARRVLK